MYLNFRKMAKPQFDSLYGSRQPMQLPTRTNYVEHETERLIVAYLGADISILTAGLIQHVLNDRNSNDSKSGIEGLNADLGKVLAGPRFETWEPVLGKSSWVIAPNSTLDLSLDPLDRARYYVFDFLRQTENASEGEIRQYMLMRLAQSRDRMVASLDVTALLRNVGKEIAPRQWQLDVDRLVYYKQLRLLFRPSMADEIRQRIERRHINNQAQPLQVDLEGMALLRDRLREANRANSSFSAQLGRLLEVLQTIVRRLDTEFGSQIDQVVATGDWAQFGIDLRNLPYEDVVLLIVVRSRDRHFNLYMEIADRVFADLDDAEFLIQFRIETSAERSRTATIAEDRNTPEILGIPLLSRP
jgi:hypothetical protein